MIATKNDLGKLLGVHATAPAYLQRAAIVAIVSFTFFVAMLAAFYVRKHFGYFLLAASFLVVYLFTMAGWWMQKRNILKLYENGLSYKKLTTTWDSVTATVESVDKKGAVTITLTDRKKQSVTIPPTLDRSEQVVALVRSKLTSPRQKNNADSSPY